MTIFITGGAGFIGSNFVNNWLTETDEKIINLDLLTYAASLSNLGKYENDNRHIFFKGNILDKDLILHIFKKYNPRAIINFAAESHVDRSINDPNIFIETNINGTFNLLESSLEFWKNLPRDEKYQFRFLQISTDEVYGSLGEKDPSFSEESQFSPNSPYSASKASADHLVRSYFKTYNLPTLITHSSNNYGPLQYKEKFIPLIIDKAIRGEKIPIYGNGENIRDWIYVNDNCEAIKTVLKKGVIGESYNIGGLNQKTNNQIAKNICKMLDEYSPLKKNLDFKKHEDLLTFVNDRPGHDKRYSINSKKIINKLGWKPLVELQNGLKKTIFWYLKNFEL